MSDPAQTTSPPVKSPSKSPKSPSKSPTNPASSPINEAAPLVADENPDEGDDLGIEVGAESDTTSLKSSILKYREENGRTYHAYKDGAYVLPNDEAENERLDLQHNIFLLTFDHRLHVAPIQKQASRVLDAGCGTGIWSIDYGDEHPDAHVTGVDLSPIQPVFVPPNVLFYVDDLRDDWAFSTPFDFIFARFMTGSINDWPRFFKQSYDNLNPGGYIELQDILYPISSDDGTVTEGSALHSWSVLVNEAFRSNGHPMDTALDYPQQLSEAGFVDIAVVKEKWPSNRWPRDRKYKQIGIYHQEILASGITAVSLAVFTRPKSEGGLGWSVEETQVLLANVRREMRSTDIHSYFRIHAVYARKPETAV